MTEPLRVLVREPIAEAGIDLLRERFQVDVDGESALPERIGDYDALIIRSATKVTADLLERARRLKVIGRAGVGVDNVDVEAATRRGIVVANAPESTVISAAEHTIGLLVALARNIPQAHAALKQGRWERGPYGGVELADKTLGVLGWRGARSASACASSRSTRSSLPSASASSAWSGRSRRTRFSAPPTS